MKKSNLIKNASKILSLMLAMILAVCLAGCGQPEKGDDSEIGKLLSEGYSITMSTAGETVLGVLLQKDGSFDTVYMAKAGMNEKKYEEYSLLMDSDDPEAARESFICKLADVTLLDITDEIPARETLDGFIGMTLGELEDSGFESCGYSGEAGEYTFFYDGPAYSLSVTPEAGTMTGDIDDYSANALRALTIGGVEFSGFSFSIFDKFLYQ